MSDFWFCTMRSERRHETHSTELRMKLKQASTFGSHTKNLTLSWEICSWEWTRGRNDKRRQNAAWASRRKKKAKVSSRFLCWVELWDFSSVRLTLHTNEEDIEKLQSGINLISSNPSQTLAIPQHPRQLDNGDEYWPSLFMDDEEKWAENRTKICHVHIRPLSLVGEWRDVTMGG